MLGTSGWRKRSPSTRPDSPPRLRLGAVDAWTARRAELSADRDRAAEDLAGARRDGAAFERTREGRPLDDLITQLRDSGRRADAATSRTAAIERRLVQLGPAALDEQRLVRVLGRRDDLETDGDRRRYDQLAGRLAVFDVLQTQQDEPGRWLQTTGTPERDVAIWRGDRELTLSRPQRRIVQEHRQEVERSRDLGRDFGW